MNKKWSCGFVPTALAVAVLVFGAAFAQADPGPVTDWYQYQGPDRDGTSPGTGLARSWPEDGPKALWTVPLGNGWAGPAVRDGKVYVLDRIEKKSDVLRCYDLATGEQLWSVECEAEGKMGWDGSRATVTVTDTHVYGVGLLGDAYCFDIEKQALVWRRNVVEDFKAGDLAWGMAQAPVIHGEKVLLSPQGPEPSPSVVALDCATGETVWQAESLGGMNYSCPIVTTLCGSEQVVMIGAELDAKADKPGKIAGISLEDGSQLWSIISEWQCKIPIPSAVTLPDDRLFITAGYNAGSAMLKVTRDDGKFAVEELYTSDKYGSQLFPALLIDGHLYLNSNENGREDGMACVALDGELLWKTSDTEGLPTFERGNLLAADGMIFNLSGKTGILHMIDPSPEGYKELGRAKLLDGKFIWAPMALTDGKLLLRDLTQMKCVDLVNP